MEETWLRLKLEFSTTRILLAVNLAIYALSFALTMLLGSSGGALLLLGAEYPELILEGEVWRLILPSFLHAGLFHLGFNMFALYQLGGIVENFYGSKKLFTVYVLTGLCGSLLSFGSSVLGALYFQEFTFGISVGASASVFGLIGLLIGNRFKRNTYSLSIDDYINTSTLWVFVIYNLLIGFGVNFLGASVSINNWAHIGGFIGGVLLGMFLDLINNFDKSELKRNIEELMFWAALTMVAASVFALILSTFSLI